MNAPATRRVLAHGVIGLGVLVGVHIFAVEPAARRLADARAQVARRDTVAATLRAVQTSLPAIEAAAESARSQMQLIEAAGLPARDPGALFARLASVAARHDVRVEQLDPFDPPHRSTPTAGPPDARAPRDARLGYTMTLDASYADLAAFLAAIRRELGFVRITSVRITPSGEADRVSARVQTVHHAFDLAAAPAAGEGP